jgi:ABC-type antimicrobial peptide transport system permease subunit
VRRCLPFDYAVLNLTRRPWRTLLTGLSSALVAALLVTTAAFVRGLERSYETTAELDTAVLLSAASMKDVVRSSIAPAVADLVAADVNGVLRVDGVAAVSPEIHMASYVRLGAAPVPGGEADEEADADPKYPAFVRGVTARAFLVHPAVTLTSGALPRDDEVLVGRLAAAKLGVPEGALALGRKLRLESGTWTVSGTFAAQGANFESEIWAPLAPLRGLGKRDDVSAVFVRVASRAGFSELELFARRRLDLELLFLPSTSYYRELSAYFAPLRMLAWAMAALIGVAALLSAANTLNAAVQDRGRELATLRALGYRGLPLAWSLAQESSVLAGAGGLLGLALARLLVAGSSVRLAMSAFTLEVDPPCVLAGLAGVLLLGLLGTVPAAVQVLNLPVAAALKQD